MYPFIGEFLHIVDVGQTCERITVEMILAEDIVFFIGFFDFIPGGGNILIGQEGNLRPVRHGVPISHRVDEVI